MFGIDKVFCATKNAKSSTVPKLSSGVKDRETDRALVNFSFLNKQENIKVNVVLF